jgi:DNA-binding LacI/PurR family transcriptional regulator
MRWPASLTTGRTKLIGLVSNNFHNPIFLEVFDLFTRGFRTVGLRPLLVNLSDETDPANSSGCCGNTRSMRGRGVLDPAARIRQGVP